MPADEAQLLPGQLDYREIDARVHRAFLPAAGAHEIDIRPGAGRQL